MIRPVETSDLDALQALYSHLTPVDAELDSTEAARILAAFGAYPGSVILGAFDEGDLVGSCALVIDPNLTRGGAPFGLIENVVTRSDRRRVGLGRAVLRAACDRAWAAGCYKVMLLAGSTDPAVLGFYVAAGFDQSKTGFQKRRLPPQAA